MIKNDFSAYGEVEIEVYDRRTPVSPELPSDTHFPSPVYVVYFPAGNFSVVSLQGESGWAEAGNLVSSPNLSLALSTFISAGMLVKLQVDSSNKSSILSIISNVADNSKLLIDKLLPVTKDEDPESEEPEPPVAGGETTLSAEL